MQFREGSRAYREDHAADLSVHWMAFEGAKEPRYLGSEMIVLDIEDFDGDGKSEFVFWLNAYNRNGYVIVWDNFRQRSSFIWSYH